MKHLVSQEDIEKYKNEKEIIELTVRQVIKDFGMFGVDVHFSGNTFSAYDELFEQLSIIIAELLKNDYNKLQAILYQVDQNPKKIFDEDDHIPLEEKITEKILNREFQKVLTRIYFKNNPDKL